MMVACGQHAPLIYVEKMFAISLNARALRWAEQREAQPGAAPCQAT